MYFMPGLGAGKNFSSVGFKSRCFLVIPLTKFVRNRSESKLSSIHPNVENR